MESIRQTPQGFIDMGAKLEARARRVLALLLILFLLFEKNL
jgi:hypothetical protein